jgi:hypothetical protein
MLFSILLSACGGKKTDAPPPVGWHQEEGWGIQCYFPADYESLTNLDRKMKRSETIDAMIMQWDGTQTGGTHFGERVVESMETIMLGEPEKIEQISRENLTHCKSVATGGSKDAWIAWLKEQPQALTAGQCNRPFVDTVFDYVNIETAWEREFNMCKDNKIVISASPNDKFRVKEGGDWITVEGDQNQSALGTDLPCNIEGCFVGQLVLRFTSSDGVETVHPIGNRLVFTAPSHGTISYTINDDSYFDNKWYQSGGLIDHASVEISPAE